MSAPPESADRWIPSVGHSVRPPSPMVAETAGKTCFLRCSAANAATVVIKYPDIGNHIPAGFTTNNENNHRHAHLSHDLQRTTDTRFTTSTRTTRTSTTVPATSTATPTAVPPPLLLLYTQPRSVTIPHPTLTYICVTRRLYSSTWNHNTRYSGTGNNPCRISYLKKRPHLACMCWLGARRRHSYSAYTVCPKQWLTRLFTPRPQE